MRNKILSPYIKFPSRLRSDMVKLKFRNRIVLELEIFPKEANVNEHMPHIPKIERFVIINILLCRSFVNIVANLV